jgi:cytoskeletal protein CcmA (bactofilin family)
MFNRSRPARDNESANGDTGRQDGAGVASGATRVPGEPRGVLNMNKPSIISAGFELVGDLVSTGVVHVEGTVRGNLKLSAVTIGSTGQVVGTIECRTLHIKGRFSGQARCEELTLSSDAAVDGSMCYSQMSAQRGARIKGDLIKNPNPSRNGSPELPASVDLVDNGLPEIEGGTGSDTLR